MTSNQPASPKGPTPPRRPYDLIDIPDISSAEFGERLSALGLTQSQVEAFTDLSRLRVRRLESGEPGSGKTDGTCYRYMYILLTLLESGIMRADLADGWDFKHFELELAKIVNQKALRSKKVA